ncbi:DNA repair protein RecO [Candidatus Methylopumilus turicensis]|uniref:DNA repair protein RecO n=1 Tax=Candidatus Methylopumilus turicensis TaxID=1581680 RepID=A0A0B7IV45_9PROT|nr:DNA repair protein RecO [Candidatus Methylopumilus turicensis]CEN56115.1 DNA repair protein RecO [Candidatus Methylopumilus turicensis]
MAVSSITRQDNQPVYVLHTYPFKETSLVVELFTRDFGRVSAVAKGARRPRSAMRGMLQSFQPLLGAWSGKLELKTLHSLEWYAGLLMLQGEALMCGFYLNELLLRLLPREDAHEALFDEYTQTLKLLSLAPDDSASILRRFELRLLQALGYSVPLTHNIRDEAVIAEAQYYYVPEVGPVSLRHDYQENGVQLFGKTLLDMAQDDYADLQTQQQSKQLMRLLVAHYLGDKPLHTRQLLIDLQDL